MCSKFVCVGGWAMMLKRIERRVEGEQLGM